MVVRELITLLGFKVDDSKAKQYAGALDGITKKVMQLAGPAAIAGLGYKFLTLAGDMEQTRIAFTTMLGSAEKATGFIAELQKFAASTPFEFTELTNYAKAMIGVGFASEDVIPALTTLGNIASGVGKEKLPNIVLAFDKMKSKGRASLEELWPMVEAGVPILETLATQLGVKDKDAVIALATAGKLSFDQVYKGLKQVESVKFAGLMIKQSKSFLGVMSNVADIIGQFATTVGTDLLPYAKDLATEFLNWFETNKKFIASGFIAFFKGVAFVLGYVMVIVENLIADWGLLSEEGGILTEVLGALGDVFKWIGDFLVKHHKFTSALIAVIIVLIAVQWAWNVAMMANPIGLVIAAIIALIAIGVMLYKNWDKIKKFFIGLWNGPLSGKVIRYLLLPFAPFIALAAIIIRNWTPIKSFFSTLWTGIVDTFNWAIDKIKAGWSYVAGAAKAVGKFFGFGGKEETPKKYAVGSSFVMNDGMAMLHRGEKVLTAGQVERASNNGMSSSINVDSNITVQVPTGTPDMQASYVRKAAKQAVQEEWQSILRQARVSTPIAAAGRA